MMGSHPAHNGVLTGGETYFRNYLIDALVGDLQALQQHAWLSNSDFDTLIQYLQFEKTSPSQAFNGVSPSAAGSGVPLTTIPENHGTDMEVGIFQMKTYNVERVNAGITDLRVQQPPAANALPPSYDNSNEAHSRIVLAISEFQTSEEGDLPFQVGQRIEIVEDVDSNWYRGQYDGRKGIFPKSFVEELKVSARPPQLPRR
ncbi:SH3 domain-containing protein [Powellomyces hirtus]|nr:SH3 domain-containing protein [Powellomyces hirtus]